MNKNWTEQELRASVEAYVEMQRLEAAGQPFNKKSYYRHLAERFGRSLKSYEYRMQNISYVYSLQGRQWVSGLKPARNVGANVIQYLERLIADSEGQRPDSDTDFNAEVEKLRRKASTVRPKGKKKPEFLQAEVTRFVRDPQVVAWVQTQAAGHCECCEAPAPFIREDGSPFLEVHHVQRLADGGEDTVHNAVALCPNCHRELHYGEKKRELANEIRAKISRLTGHARN